jgi:hypothetical protein
LNVPPVVFAALTGRSPVGNAYLAGIGTTSLLLPDNE